MDWTEEKGYKGRCYVLGGDWRCVVAVDPLSRNRPYRVRLGSMVESSYPTLEAAQARVIALIAGLP